jgi:hypothetical protein
MKAIGCIGGIAKHIIHGGDIVGGDIVPARGSPWDEPLILFIPLAV